MATAGQPPTGDRLRAAGDGDESIVALALFQAGINTRAARFFKELSRWSPGPVDMETLAAAAEARPEVRRAAIRRARTEARQAIKASKALRLTIVSAGSELYPEQLSQIPDPPIVLWVRGHADILRAPAVAIVGSRTASAAGLAIARRLGREVAESGLVVVSGLARGVDGAAHRGALDAGGPTIAVLGSGVDVVYPAEHDDLAAGILDRGALVSEFAPGTPPLPTHFPLRNRIISGLSKAVVVIEASEKSGSLITAKAALEQGRDVLAVPGSVMSGGYRGSHALIKDGARLVDTVDDVLDEIKWRPLRPRSGQESSQPLQLSRLEETMALGEPYSVDELAARTSRPIADLLAELGTLEIAGRVTRTAGGDFVRS